MRRVHHRDTASELRIRCGSSYYPMFCDFTHKSKNLYNHANDVNGAYQIMKKVFPNAYADGIEGVALHPVRVSVA